jgi:LDH2 family malate/lactate/ureidoglycolate dehydrogenase
MHPVDYLKDFTYKVFRKTGCSEADAATISEVLVAAETRGIASHGMIRVKDYYQMWQKGRINIRPSVKVVRETPGTAVVDGDASFGMVAAKRSMETAIEKARQVGTGWVSTQNSSHFGIAGYYSMMALEHDMIGVAMTNANPLVAPTYSISRMLGTNPIAIAIPAHRHPAFVADFATTPIARGKLAIKGKKGESIEEGFVQDARGRASTDPDIIRKGGAILPLGGDRLHGSHKGYCLSAIVDIFSSVFSGANFGPFVPPQVPYLDPPSHQTGKGLGHFFGAMRIDAWQEKEEFKKRMDQWIDTFKKSENAPDQPRVMVPGDPEREMEEKTRKEGVRLIGTVQDDLEEVARDLGLTFERD